MRQSSLSLKNCFKLSKQTRPPHSSSQYTADGCCGNVEWSVSGTGATISSTGLLTAGATACGTLTVTASCSGCGTSATQHVRVADAGRWVFQSMTGYTCGYTSWCHPYPSIWCEQIFCYTGATKEVYDYVSPTACVLQTPCPSTCSSCVLGNVAPCGQSVSSCPYFVGAKTYLWSCP